FSTSSRKRSIPRHTIRSAVRSSGSAVISAATSGGCPVTPSRAVRPRCLTRHSFWSGGDPCAKPANTVAGVDQRQRAEEDGQHETSKRVGHPSLKPPRVDDNNGENREGGCAEKWHPPACSIASGEKQDRAEHQC